MKATDRNGLPKATTSATLINWDVSSCFRRDLWQGMMGSCWYSWTRFCSLLAFRDVILRCFCIAVYFDLLLLLLAILVASPLELPCSKKGMHDIHKKIKRGKNYSRWFVVAKAREWWGSITSILFSALSSWDWMFASLIKEINKKGTHWQ